MKYLITFIAMSFFIFSCVGTAKSKSPLTVVDSVDLQRYLGKWYEIASYPAWFQKRMYRVDRRIQPAARGKNSGGQSLPQGQPGRTAERVERKSRGCGYRHQRQTQGLVLLALQGQLLDNRPQPGLPMGRGGRTLTEISMDSKPHTHHGRGRLSGNFGAFTAKRL